MYLRISRSPLVGHIYIYIYIFFVLGKIPVRVTSPGFELTSKRQKVSRLPN